MKSVEEHVASQLLQIAISSGVPILLARRIKTGTEQYNFELSFSELARLGHRLIGIDASDFGVELRTGFFGFLWRQFEAGVVSRLIEPTAFVRETLWFRMHFGEVEVGVFEIRENEVSIMQEFAA